MNTHRCHLYAMIYPMTFFLPTSALKLPKHVFIYPNILRVLLSSSFCVTLSIFSFQAFEAIEALSDGAVKMGLPRGLAMRLGAQALVVCVCMNRYFIIIIILKHTYLPLSTSCTCSNLSTLTPHLI